jgi:hypothetical protein
MHDGEIDPVLILCSSEHRFQLGGYVKAVRVQSFQFQQLNFYVH